MDVPYDFLYRRWHEKDWEDPTTDIQGSLQLLLHSYFEGSRLLRQPVFPLLGEAAMVRKVLPV